MSDINEQLTISFKLIDECDFEIQMIDLLAKVYKHYEAILTKEEIDIALTFFNDLSDLRLKYKGGDV